MNPRQDQSTVTATVGLNKQQLLDTWFEVELKKSAEEMKRSEDALDNALKSHGLSLTEKDPLHSIKRLLSPEIKEDKINKLNADLNDLNALLADVLNKQVSKDPKGNAGSKAYAKVRTWFASKEVEVEPEDKSQTKSKVKGNTREKIKPYLSTVSGITKLDKAMDDYQSARVQYLTNLIAYKNAQRTLIRRSELQNRYPNAYVDDVRLVRHEVCTNATKQGGMKKDTGLTAFYKPHSSKQSKYDLAAIKQTRSMCARALKSIGEMKYVGLHVSPIKRAYQTAVYAGFDADIPDTTLVSRLYTETKHGKTATFGARSSDADHEDGALEQLLETMDSFKDKTIMPNTFSKNVVERQEERIENAVKSIFDEVPVSLGASEIDVFAHGGANRDFIASLAQRLHREGIPNNIPFGKAAKVGFGDEFILHIIRDRHDPSKIIAVDYEGQFTNRGVLRPHITKQKPGQQLSDKDHDEMEHDDYTKVFPADKDESIKDASNASSPGKFHTGSKSS